MTHITGIQIIGIIIASVVFYQARVLYKENKFKRRDFQMWTIVSAVLLIVSIFPNAINYSLNYLKINRALDALLILGVFGAYLLIFQLYVRIQETQREITDVVREVALRSEEKGKEK